MKWDDLGLQLGLSIIDLKKVQKLHPFNNKRIKLEMLAYWINVIREYDTSPLLEYFKAFRNLGYYKLAQSLAIKYNLGKKYFKSYLMLINEMITRTIMTHEGNSHKIALI